MLSRAGKGIKASQLRVLFFELEQPWERIKNLNATQVGAHFRWNVFADGLSHERFERTYTRKPGL